MKFDYSWRCDCDAEGSEEKLSEAKTVARKHLKTHKDKAPNWQVFIDQHEKDGDMTDKYWTIVKNK